MEQSRPRPVRTSTESDKLYGERLDRWDSINRANEQSASEEDKIASEQRNVEARTAANETERRDGESNETFIVRMRNIHRRKMSGAEVMAYDHAVANADRETIREARLQREPFPIGKITELVDNTVTVVFDPTHPYAPNADGEIIVSFGNTMLRGDDGPTSKRRMQEPPTVDSVGIILDIGDGIGHVLGHLLIVDGDLSYNEPKTDNPVDKPKLTGVVSGMADGGGFVISTIDLDGGGIATVSNLEKDAPVRGTHGVVSIDSDNKYTFTPDTPKD